MDLNSLFSPYSVRVASVEYAMAADRMEAIFRMTMSGDCFDEPLHDQIMQRFDGFADEDWTMEALDLDHDDQWAYAVFRIVARNSAACGMLQPYVLANMPTFA